jgi:peptidoglycan/LPS O-acetylase OafA/YrhL
MRAVGALAVLTTHTAFWAGDYTGHGTWGTLLARMDVGVSLFFVLSGFLLSRAYLARASFGLSSPALGSYFWKRFLRIFPVYAVTVVVCFTFIDDDQGATALQWVTTLLLANVYVDTSLPAGLTQMWSLAVEVAFYLVLPALMALAIGRRRRLRPARVVALLLVLTAFSMWWHLDLAARAPESALPLQWLPAYLSWFAVGIGLALAHVRASTGQSPGRTVRALQALARHPGSCWAMAGGLLLVSATPLAGPTMLAAATTAQSLTKSLLYATIGGLLILPGIFPVAGSTYLRVMSAGPLRHLGLISYGIFCIHLPMLHLVMWMTGYPLFTGHGAQIWILTFVLAVLAAELIYRVVERPSMRLRRPGIRGRSSSTISKAPASETSAR